jgi:hypothetical protein
MNWKLLVRGKSSDEVVLFRQMIEMQTKKPGGIFGPLSLQQHSDPKGL